MTVVSIYYCFSLSTGEVQNDSVIKTGKKLYRPGAKAEKFQSIIDQNRDKKGLHASGILAQTTVTTQDNIKWPKSINEIRKFKSELTPQEKKLDWHLFKMIKELEKKNITSTNYKKEPLIKKYSSSIMQFDDEARILCRIELIDGFTESKINQIFKSIKDIHIINFSKGFTAAIAYLPFYSIEQVSLSNKVRFISPILPDTTNIGNINSEGLSILRAEETIQSFGFDNADGTGIRIGVISDGVNPNGLPVLNHSDLGDAGDEFIDMAIVGSQEGINSPGPQLWVMRNDQNGNTAEGTAMLEIVHDLCPQADLIFCNGNIGGGTFDDAINSLSDAGCQIIVDDLINYSQPYFEDNAGLSAPIFDAINTYVEEKDGLYFCSAGNDANRHYEAQFSDNDGNSIHNFSENDEELDFKLNPGEKAFIAVQWSSNWGSADWDIDIQLWEKDLIGGDDFVTDDITVNLNHNPFAFIEHTNTGFTEELYLKVFVSSKLSNAAENVRLEIYMEDDCDLIDKNYIITNGSAFGHHVYENIISVGAIPYLRREDGWPDNYPYEAIADYSSFGPHKILENIVTQSFTERMKPDIVAVDGVHVSGAFNFPVSDPNNPGSLFWGTSAAAPHAAAIAGLIKSANPYFSNNEIRTILLNSAREISLYNYDGKTGLSIETGHGKIDAYSAIQIGRRGNQAYSHTQDFVKCYTNSNSIDGGRNPGHPIEDVQSNWNGVGYEKQKFRNGAVFYNTAGGVEAFWLGEGIWDKWIEMGGVSSELGLPTSTEMPDADNNDYPTVGFEHGVIYWNGSEAISIIRDLQADFSVFPQTGYAPLNVQFTDLCTTLNTAIISWEWDFGDGFNSTDANPSHTYIVAGSYTVSLTVSGTGGTNDQETKTGLINVQQASPLVSPTGRIPDTGQTCCYNEDRNIACPSPGEAFYGQDASYTTNPMSYTKLGYSGVELPDTATLADGWIMTRDNVTGLIWEVKQNQDGVKNYDDPHDADNQYTWYDSNPETNGGDAGTPGDGTDTEDFVNALNAENFGGYSDWRIPDIKELDSIFDLFFLHSSWPTINTNYFPNTLKSDYWTSTSLAAIVDNAWGVGYSAGKDFRNRKDYYSFVRAVRGEGKETDVTNHFVNNGNGTVTDTATGLLWQKVTAPGTYAWSQALDYCEGLTLGGQSNWRLPNRKELRGIVDYSQDNPSIETDFFTTTQSAYWSSTTVVYIDNTEFAWSVYFTSGFVHTSYKRSVYFFVRAVCGGHSGTLGPLAILMPNQASAWAVGSIMPIRWNTQSLGTNVKISLSRQGGKDASFETIIESTLNNGQYDWAITRPTSVNCVIKIEQADNPANWASDGLFVITQLKGDINGDAAIDLTDAILALQIITGVVQGQNIDNASDVDGNNKIGMEEAVYILENISGTR